MREWASQRSATGSNLHSDGISLWSYGWYEIGRHVGDGLTYIRHPDENYSASTARHISLASSNGVGLGLFSSFHVHGASAVGRYSSSKNYLGQPDWDWISWAWWFHGAATSKLTFKILPTAKFRGNALKAGFRDMEQKLRIDRLLPGWPGRVSTFATVMKNVSTVTFSGGYQHATTHQSVYSASGTEVDFHVDELVSCNLPLSIQVALPALEEPRWPTLLFPDVDPPDARDAFALGDNAFWKS